MNAHEVQTVTNIVDDLFPGSLTDGQKSLMVADLEPLTISTEQAQRRLEQTRRTHKYHRIGYQELWDTLRQLNESGPATGFPEDWQPAERELARRVPNVTNPPQPSHPCWRGEPIQAWRARYRDIRDKYREWGDRDDKASRNEAAPGVFAFLAWSQFTCHQMPHKLASAFFHHQWRPVVDCGSDRPVCAFLLAWFAHAHDAETLRRGTQELHEWYRDSRNRRAPLVVRELAASLPKKN